MFKIINRLKNKKGFTLIELIVVLAVLGIIAMIAVPRFLQVQAKAKYDADMSTVQGIEKAAELWAIQTSASKDDTISVTSLGDLGYFDDSISWQSVTSDPINSVTVQEDGSVVIDHGLTKP